MSNEITIKKIEGIKAYSLNKPAEIVQMAKTLKAYVVKQGLYSEIQRKNYAHVEGWQFAGFFKWR